MMVMVSGYKEKTLAKMCLEVGWKKRRFLSSDFWLSVLVVNCSKALG
jgi:hypothetical protein